MSKGSKEPAILLQVGNKSFGLEALMKHLGLTPSGVSSLPSNSSFCLKLLVRRDD